jgi:hypothetical protein
MSVKVSISEHQFLTTTDELREEIISMIKEFAHDAGIDWQFEYRWAIMTDENYMLAKIKHNRILTALTVRMQ